MTNFKKKSFLIIKIVIFILAYIFIFYKIKKLDLNNFNFYEYNLWYLIFAFLLMFANWSVEAYKLILLVSDIQKLSFKDAFKSTTISIVFGLFTPNRLGEIPGKTILLEKQNRIKGTVASSLGSFAQFTITLVLGLVGSSFFFFFIKNADLKQYFSNETFLIIIFLAIVFIIAYFNPSKLEKLLVRLKFSEKITAKFEILSTYKRKKLFQILSLSFFRYLIFTLQFYLILLYFNINLPTIIAFSSIFLILLLMNILPHFVIADLGIRGSISIFVFGQFLTITPEIISAPILLWIINIMIPALLGQFFISKLKVKKIIQ